MQLLLSYTNDNALVTQTVLAAAAEHGRYTFTPLLDYRGEKSDISEAVVVAAARNGRGYIGNFKILLGRYASKIEITEAVLVAVADSYIWRAHIVETILELKQDTALQVTESVLCAVAGNSVGGACMMESLHKYSQENMGSRVEFLQGAITQSVLQAAAANKSPALMRDRLDSMHGDIHVTAPVIEAAMANVHAGVPISILKLLCKRSDEAMQIYLSMGGKQDDVVKEPDFFNFFV
jgi:hypothetical protein